MQDVEIGWLCSLGRPDDAIRSAPRFEEVGIEKRGVGTATQQAGQRTVSRMNTASKRGWSVP